MNIWNKKLVGAQLSMRQFFYIIMSPILKEEDLQLDVIPSFLSRTREKAKDMVHWGTFLKVFRLWNELKLKNNIKTAADNHSKVAGAIAGAIAPSIIKG